MEKGEYETTCFWVLPEGCISEILSLTSPLDVCRFSLVSKSVQSAADSDSVWEKFLPSDYKSIIAQSSTPIPDFHSKKDLYVYLCRHPILIDGGRKSFSLEKTTGKKCYFLGARDLTIVWSDTPQYWKWTSLSQSRFPEVAALKLVWWLEIWGTIRARVLSPLTSYVAYFVYKLEDDNGFDYRPSEVSVGVSGVEFEKRFAFLVPDGERQRENEHGSVYTPPPSDDESFVYTIPSDEGDDWQPDDEYEESVHTLHSDAEHEGGRPDHGYEESIYTLPSDAEDEGGQADDDHGELVNTPPEEQGGGQRQEESSSLKRSDIPRPKLREDGWFEIELGEFFSENADDLIEIRMQEVKSGYPKRGLIVEGIEIRPRMG